MCLEIKFLNVSVGGYDVVSAKDWREVAEKVPVYAVTSDASGRQMYTRIGILKES